MKDLEKLFRYRVLKMLLGKGRITEEFVRRMDGWRHSGFNVFAGGRIQPREKKSLENLAADLIRSSTMETVCIAPALIMEKTVIDRIVETLDPAIPEMEEKLLR